MAKDYEEMTDRELAVEMRKREDSLDHLSAKAEMFRRQTVATIDAAKAQERNATYMLWATIAAAVSAFISLVSTILANLPGGITLSGG